MSMVISRREHADPKYCRSSDECEVAEIHFQCRLAIPGHSEVRNQPSQKVVFFIGIIDTGLAMEVMLVPELPCG